MKGKHLFKTTSDSSGNWSFGTFRFPEQYYVKETVKECPSTPTQTQMFFESVTPEKEKYKPVENNDSKIDLCENEDFKVDFSHDVFKLSTPPCVQKILDSVSSFPEFEYEPFPEYNPTPVQSMKPFVVPKNCSPNSNDSTHFDDCSYDFNEDNGSVVFCDTRKVRDGEKLLKCFKEIIKSSCNWVLKEGELEEMLHQSTKVYIVKGDPFMSYGSFDFQTTYDDSVILAFGLLKEMKNKDNDQITLLASKKGFEGCSDRILCEIKFQTKRGRTLYAFTDFP